MNLRKYYSISLNNCSIKFPYFLLKRNNKNNVQCAATIHVAAFVWWSSASEQQFTKPLTFWKWKHISKKNHILKMKAHFEPHFEKWKHNLRTMCNASHLMNFLRFFANFCAPTQKKLSNCSFDEINASIWQVLFSNYFFNLRTMCNMQQQYM